ncbi:MAG: hypothetical protein GF341_07360 [candidate division Zixibacteria bacterium]|nr:hypothetical protein [candidate division Zixibacteria bacterium]
MMRVRKIVSLSEEIYCIVNVSEWAANPQPVQNEYLIVDGEHQSLPGYYFGKTPFVFDSSKTEFEESSSTTPYNGTLYGNGFAVFTDDPLPCDCPFQCDFDANSILDAVGIIEEDDTDHDVEVDRCQRLVSVAVALVFAPATARVTMPSELRFRS